MNRRETTTGLGRGQRSTAAAHKGGRQPTSGGAATFLSHCRRRHAGRGGDRRQQGVDYGRRRSKSRSTEDCARAGAARQPTRRCRHRGRLPAARGTPARAREPSVWHAPPKRRRASDQPPWLRHGSTNGGEERGPPQCVDFVKIEAARGRSKRHRPRQCPAKKRVAAVRTGAQAGGLSARLLTWHTPGAQRSEPTALPWRPSRSKRSLRSRRCCGPRAAQPSCQRAAPWLRLASAPRASRAAARCDAPRCHVAAARAAAPLFSAPGRILRMCFSVTAQRRADACNAGCFAVRGRAGQRHWQRAGHRASHAGHGQRQQRPKCGRRAAVAAQD